VHPQGYLLRAHAQITVGQVSSMSRALIVVGKLALGELELGELDWANLHWAKDHGITLTPGRANHR